MRKLQLVALAIFIAVSMVITGVNSQSLYALVQGDVAAWQASDNTLPDVMRASSSAVYNDYVYEIGGDNSGGATNTVSYTHLNGDGTIGAWQAATVLPASFLEPAVAAYNGYLYVMGGYGGSTKNTVYYATINNDGSIGSWVTSSNNLPYSANAATGVAYNGYLYYFGGVNFSTTYNNVSYAPINNDGSVGTWAATTAMPDIRFRASSFIANGRVYVVGGHNAVSNQNTVMYANLNNNGTVGSWTTSPNSLPQNLQAGGAAYVNEFAYYVGGNNGSSPVSTVYYAKVNTDGTTESWATATNALPIALDAITAVGDNDYLYVIGGANSVGDKVDTVYSAQVTPYNASADDDSDGVSNGAEDAAPNSGDANDDGTLDSKQSNVASFVSPVTGKDVSLVLNNDGAICDITSVSLARESANSTQDVGYDYSLGMFDFTASCPSEGAGNSVSLLYFGEDYNENFIIRKYNATTHEYATIAEPYIESYTDSGNNNVLGAYYYAQDGGELDADGVANSTIIDPVGLALTATQTDDSGSGGATTTDSSAASDQLAETGKSVSLYILISTTFMIAGASVLSISYRRYRAKL
jgi:hypothetical protein